MVIKGNQILIPTSLRSDILKDLHIPHLGIVKTNLLAKTCVYWPKMTKVIQDLTEECSECQIHQRRQSPVEFVNRKLPREPWDAVAADLFEFNKEQYLLVADIYTKFPILRKLRSTHSQSIIHALKRYSRNTVSRDTYTRTMDHNYQQHISFNSLKAGSSTITQVHRTIHKAMDSPSDKSRR